MIVAPCRREELDVELEHVLPLPVACGIPGVPLDMHMLRPDVGPHHVDESRHRRGPGTMHPEDENLPASADDSSMIHRRIHSFKHSRGGGER